MAENTAIDITHEDELADEALDRTDGGKATSPGGSLGNCGPAVMTSG